ncbi:SIMPL domain-containing protein [Sporosarcina thermotolerans]|uniref:SIMPL domain-containing protein n=1 Tax=Sporosarcina thermotolerans TaxID=633404 RepID=A0AAW9A6W2_9BACL|nr:SIMPL domain-containing protein [Sporosarcina thermotolerans]MDW0115969.1 SIMPL domain-containing protein [Sporosarcina thermotolerans]WHT46823.1 SIMPL domain-containing protein [Sporosarcina thermotolerans]
MYYPYIRQQVKHSYRLITVVGNGEVAAEPDVATIQLEINTQSKELQDAQQENATLMNQVIQSLYQLGIPRENIQTVSYSIFPRYDFVDGEQVFRGYEVTNAIAVTLSDIQQVGTVIDTAVANGANRVSNVQFSVRNVEQHKQEAIVKALQDAQVKARTIANTLHLQINPEPIKVTELAGGREPPVAFKSVNMAAGGTPIEGGQITIRSTMRVQYEY